MEFKYGWEQFTEDYCFIANSYYVPFEEEVPADFSLRADHISYYRWVPIVLALQAFFFYFPNWVWSMLHKRTAVNPQAVISEVRKCRNLCGAQREKEVENVAHYIADAIGVFGPSQEKTAARSGYNATLIYLFIKLLYLINVIGQLIILNRFLGGEYFSWGIQTMQDVIKGNEWKESEIFPRVILCDFQVRRLGNIQRYTVQCVIMMNLINEKLYFFLYFWLIFVGIVTLLNFFYTLATMCLPLSRINFIKCHLNQQETQNFPELNLSRFVHEYLRPDGVLLVHFVRQHLGGRITFDLMNELIRLYWLKSHKGYLNRSPESDKCLPRGANYNDNIKQAAPTFAPPTYKPTSYGHSALYPTGNPAPPGFISPTTTQRTSPDDQIDYIDDGTLRIGELNRETRPSTPRNDSGAAVKRTPISSQRPQNSYSVTPKTTSSV
uniref:Innexin n=1 Tax=Acrobeloides nanus TaxID=290746 RepID=A0A914CLW9_9BILA